MEELETRDSRQATPAQPGLCTALCSSYKQRKSRQVFSREMGQLCRWQPFLSPFLCVTSLATWIRPPSPQLPGPHSQEPAALS